MLPAEPQKHTVVIIPHKQQNEKHVTTEQIMELYVPRDTDEPAPIVILAVRT